MSMERAVLSDTGMNRLARNGDGMLMYPSETVQATDSNQTITAAAIASGLYMRRSITAARSDTFDTAAAILAALPQMDVGDNYIFAISVQPAFALTLVASAAVTLETGGVKTSVPASGLGFVMLTRTGTATLTYVVL